ncbi:GNAT family N-acetyltransferase [Lacticaseibacillus thailandensis]|uniref:Acetyltransferase, GNAT family n=1 Tax=Lacticaseibacillus thailandensis DSM 22698 = JCM 13996 TaxID=1423810 RepID=A0A0R2C7P1_9LACO|nr:GNAT family N-acetyltransferase [Lacticaseibacillus thailandensis]KRM87793.1 acetyltransferase, GNAT family [Lacticaseibacillus thailandensis DSM 22698 = JCM 13996]
MTNIKYTADLNSNIHRDSVKIRQEVFVQEQHVPSDLEVDADEGRCLYIVAYDDQDQPVATLRLLPADYGLHVQRVAVRKAARGTGLGRVIMNAARDYAQANGIKQLRLDAQVHATGFYSALGYSFADRPEFLDAGIRHREMYLDL